MEKEKVLKILNELTKNIRPLKIDLVEYSYLEKEHEIECFLISPLPMRLLNE